MPSSFIDGHGCLRKSNKPDVAKRLGVLKTLLIAPEILIVDVLPHGVTTWRQSWVSRVYVQFHQVSLLPSPD